MGLLDLNKLDLNIKKNPTYKDLDTIQQKMINEIIKYFKLKLDEHTKDLFIREKIKINHSVLIDLSKKSIFIKNSELAFEVTKWLKKYKYISSQSKLYPVNSKYMTSTLPDSFLNIDLSILDKILKLRDNLLYEYKNEPDVGLYIFLRLYQVKLIDKNDIIKLNKNTNIFKLNKDLHLFVSMHEKHSRGYQPLVKYIFDSKIINFINKSGIISFSKSLEIYEKEVKSYTQKYNLYFQDVKQSIQFEYAFQSCQFNLTLKLQTSYPHLNLGEIQYLFPNAIPQKLLDIEKCNKNIYFNLLEQYTDDLDDEILDINYKATDYISYDIESYEQLRECTNVPLENNKFDSYLKNYYKLISEFKKTDNSSYLYSIFDFVEILLKKADKNDSKKIIKKETLKEYLRIMFNYCFKYIVTEGELSAEVYKEIKENINIFENQLLYAKNCDITDKSTKVYYRLIKLFWKRYTNFKTETSLQMIVDIRRSVVFLNELNSFLKILAEEEISNSKNITKDIKFRQLMKPAFCLILYYSGLRKTELRTLLAKNIVLVNNKEFEIYVTKENFKLAGKAHNELELKAKTEHAIRLVRFSVDNLEHFDLIKKYITFIEKKKCKFTFPFISDKGTITKTKPLKDSYISDLPKKLSNHTERYTPLHSLRHSFATFKTLSLFKENEHFLVYELSHMLGHSEPSVTLQNYIHIDLLYILMLANVDNEIPNLKTDYSIDLII